MVLNKQLIKRVSRAVSTLVEQLCDQSANSGLNNMDQSVIFITSLRQISCHIVVGKNSVRYLSIFKYVENILLRLKY
jgi:hypothetical protein